MRPKLSICVPSRNRQTWFQQTIAGLMESNRPDVEFVFADNSDDPSVMTAFMATYAGDPRVVFLPPGPVVYSMVDNWERAVAATSGDWVTVIGDDDYVDPELAALLRKVELLIPDVDAFSWSQASFTWPDVEDAPDTNNTLELTQHFIDVPKDWLMRRAYQWVDATTAPTHGFSIYHSALSRQLIERIRQRFGGRYFEHPTVDFDSSFKSVLTGNRFLMWQRPLSIQGVCRASMSSIILDAAAFRKANVAFMQEVGRNISEDPSMEGLPFHCDMGVPASVLVTQQWIKAEAGLSFDGWEDNFARSCAYYCSKFRTRDGFDYIVGLYRDSFRRWNGGRHAHAFLPVFADLPAHYAAFSGMKDGKLYLNSRMSGAETPKDIYDMMAAISPPIDDIVIDPAMLKRPQNNADLHLRAG